MVVSVGPLATQNCEPRQVRKEAAATVAACAGVWLALATALYSQFQKNVLPVSVSICPYDPT